MCYFGVFIRNVNVSVHYYSCKLILLSFQIIIVFNDLIMLDSFDFVFHYIYYAYIIDFYFTVRVA